MSTRTDAASGDTASAFIVHGGDYEHTLELGASADERIRLRYRPLPVRQIFEGMLQSRQFEICEFSLANYMTLRANGHDWLIGLPVFPYRAFRHGLAVARRESGLTRLADLEGTRVGVEDYSMTAAVWFRGLLNDEHGIDHRAITWVTRGEQRFPFPRDANVETTDAPLEQLLLDGAIDALLGFELEDSARPPATRRLRTVLSDPRAEEEAYYRRTSIYPIMHCVVIRSDVLEREPGVAGAVCAAYAEAKDRAYRRRLGSTLAPWGKAHWARTFELFEDDPLPYGLTPSNRRVVERLAGYLVQQGFIPRLPDIDALFAAGLTRP